MLPPQPTNFGFIGRIWPELLIHCRDAEGCGQKSPCGRHSAKKTIKNAVPFPAVKKIPGIILISLNDTNLSEFLAR